METHIDFTNTDELSRFGRDLQDKINELSEVTSIRLCFTELEFLISEGEIALDQKFKEIERQKLRAKGPLKAALLARELRAHRILEKRIEELKFLRTMILNSLSFKSKPFH